MVVTRVDYNIHKNMITNLNKGNQLGDLSQVQLVNSKYKRLKEEEMVHQLDENMGWLENHETYAM